MVDEPSPPPEENEDNNEVYPFMDAAASGGVQIVIRAGWADNDNGDVQGLPVVNYQGSAGSPAATSAFETALEWYRDTVSAIARQQANATEEQTND
ncbi:MAG: hypothetical protein RI531_04730 [Haloferacaceae archaeon]|nr:hypothetical protein [Haloferacaceae archaeon]